MRILMVTPIPPAPQATNAVPLVAWAQLAALAPRHDVTIVTVAGPDPAEIEAVEDLKRSGKAVYAVTRTVSRGAAKWKRRWRLAFTWIFEPYPFRTVWYYEPEVQRILDRLLAEQSFDLIGVEDNAMGIYRYRTTSPRLLTEHEVRKIGPADTRGWPWKHGFAGMFREVDWRRWRSYQRSVWKRFQKVQVFTARDAACAAEIAPEVVSRVHINPFGIVLPCLPDPTAEQENTVIFTGGMTHPPNEDAAIWLGTEIMPLLRKMRHGVRLIIVGSYPPQSVLDLACDDIVVTGRVPEVEPYIAGAAVVVAPVRTGGGQRMKVLQGMALGKPVVATQRGVEGLAVVGADPPLLVADSAGEIARSVAALLESAEARRELGSRARAFVEEHYSPEAYARRLEAVYSELVLQWRSGK